MRWELHCHSTCSDGTEDATKVAARAAERGVAVFALTDHDTCAATGLAVANARSIRAVEMSCDDNGRTVHVLAYDRGGDWASLDARLESVRVARKNRLRMMAARLALRGIKIDIENLMAEADRRSVGRPDLARAMVAAGAASSMKDAFSRHLFDGGPVDVPHSSLPIVEALAAGRAAGAAMSLAHPHLYDERAAPMLKRLQPEGLTGLEAYYGAYDPRERSRWITIADQLGLVCTGGSDWHGPEEANGPVGVDLPDARSDALMRWLSP
ncbi:MAG: PHP domain-containing protein [Myxococcota bacterium]|nr:PHP domain-containing protein [Myxococcota bacterium]